MDAKTAMLPLNDIHAVILDLDGTLIDSVPDLDVALNGMLQDMGLPAIDEATVRMSVGRGTSHLVKSILSIHLDEQDAARSLDDALTLFYKHYRTVNGERSHMYPNVREGLERMAGKGLKIGCVTNKPSVFTEPLLAKNGIYPFFDLIYCADSFPKKKPDPFPMVMACRKFQLLPRQVVAIGDSENDAKAARAAGCSLFMVPYGYNYGIPVENQLPDAVVPDLLQAVALIS